MLTGVFRTSIRHSCGTGLASAFTSGAGFTCFGALSRLGTGSMLSFAGFKGSKSDRALSNGTGFQREGVAELAGLPLIDDFAVELVRVPRRSGLDLERADFLVAER